MDPLAFDALELPIGFELHKPRTTGLTCMLDKGLSPGALADLLQMCGRWVDVAKLGWGTARLTPRRILREKIYLYHQHGVQVATGGTLLEVAWLQGVVERMLEQAAELGFDIVEVSCGCVELSLEEKARLIAQVRQAGLIPWSEVGKKDPAEDALLPPEQRIRQVQHDLASGAERVILEGRESGTVGIFDAQGRPQADLLQQLLQQVDLTQVVLEAPRKSQQQWLLQRFGPEVNLGNIAPEEVLPLATLRGGLRADTLPRTPLPQLLHFRTPEAQAQQVLRQLSQS